MTSRTTTPPPADVAVAHSLARVGWRESPVRVRLAFGLAAAGAVAGITGIAAGVVAGQPTAGFGALPLLVALTLLPVTVAVAFAAAGRAALGANVLAGAALIEPGRLLADLQILVDPLVVSRPELMVPTSLAPLRAGLGLWLLLAGHVLLIAAGVLAKNRAGAPHGTPYAAEFDEDERPRTRMALLGITAGVVAAFGLQLSPFTSGNAFVLADDVIDSPGLLRLAFLATGLGAVVAMVAAGSPRPSVARGVVLGGALGVAAVAVPQIVAGLGVDLLGAAPGPYIAVASVVGLAAVVWLSAKAVQVDPTVKAHRVAGVLGALTGLAGVAAASSTLLVVDGIDQPETYSSRLFYPAGILVVLVAVPLVITRSAAAVRPALAAALVAIPLAGLSTLDAVVTATGIQSVVHPGVGVWFTAAAGVFALAATGAVLLAGNAERTEPEDERPLDVVLVAPLTAAGLLSIGAFGLPTVKAAGLVAPGIWSDFRLASLGLLLALITVLASVAMTPVARPNRAGALLLGCAGLVAVHALEYPLTAARAAGSAPGPGLWLSIACAAALVVSGLMVLSRK
ncbi:hypothetical protein [Actinokineospora inagensis]|uniref:hypothetical protein n=1 Tax=Actinokineospora inagensis TaxID=103730 RepID=UPI0012FCAE2B|nr:hypothetical protein [Actinokineospora inagensis]